MTRDDRQPLVDLIRNELIARNQLVIEGIHDAMTAVHFHVGCFYYWNAERRR